MRRLEFDCSTTDDRGAVNDFLSHLIRKLRRRDFKLVSESNDDGSFEIRIAGGSTTNPEPQVAIDTPVVAEAPKATKKRKKRSQDLADEAPAEVAQVNAESAIQEESTSPE